MQNSRITFAVQTNSNLYAVVFYCHTLYNIGGGCNVATTV